MTPKGRKYAIIVGGFFVLMMLMETFAPEGLRHALPVAQGLGVIFWGLALCLIGYSLWEVQKDLRRQDD